MSDGICRAACLTLGRRLDLDRGTILRALCKLRAAGLIEDLTPGLRNRPHLLRPTRQAAALITQPPAETHRAADPGDAGAAVVENDNNAAASGVGVTESDNRCGAEPHPAVAECSKNQTLLRDKKEEEELSDHQILYYRERVEYANQNILTFYKCRAIVHCRFETVKDGCLVISHPDAAFLNKADDGFRRLYERTLSQYLLEGEARVIFVRRDPCRL